MCVYNANVQCSYVAELCWCWNCFANGVLFCADGRKHATARASAASRPPSSRAKTKQKKRRQGPDISQLETRLQLTWDHKKNALLGEIIIKPKFDLKVWWRCDKCPQGHPHEWQARVKQRSTSTEADCPYCAEKAVCRHNSLATLAPQLALDWDYAANKLTPHFHTWMAMKRVGWKCHVCGHEWVVSIYHRVSKKRGCPECFANRGCTKLHKVAKPMEALTAGN